MSELHSETVRAKHRLTVRVKLVNLNHTGIPAISTHPSANLQNGHAHNAATAGLVTDCAPVNSGGAASGEHGMGSGTEICLATGLRVSSSGFESHIEECSACNNRVELQLDFMQTLEVAVYQRKADPKSKRILGAMLVSAPELNFAICGELER